MKKEIKQYGNATIIRFTAEELKIEKLKIGDFVDITIVKINKNKTKK